MSIYLSTVAPTIEFEARNVSVIESDGSVTVNLVRTGNHSNNITVCINVIRVENPAIIECTYVPVQLCTYNTHENCIYNYAADLFTKYYFY